MSRRNKLQKFAEVAGFANVYENFGDAEAQLLHRGELVSTQGRWSSAHFTNSHPITLELACGKGEYTLGLAQMFPGQNFIGVDIKGARIWKGAKRALELNLMNAAFLRTRIEQLQMFFAPGEISEIWIVFPDPFPRDSKANRRLTSPQFLEIYSRIIAPGGVVHLKTDDDHLYTYTLHVVRTHPQCELLSERANVYSGILVHDALEIRTFYELKHLAEGKTIKYVSFRLRGDH